MSADRPGWTPAEIRAEIVRRGTTIYRLATEHGFKNRGALALSLTVERRQPKAHLIIANFLGRRLDELWPHWYPDGEYRNANDERKTPAVVFERILERVALGERLKAICREPGQPTHATFRAFCRRNPAFHERFRTALGRRSGLTVPRQAFEGILTRVAAGESVVAVCAEPGMPRLPTLYDHAARCPDFGARYKAALGPRIGVKITEGQVESLVTELKLGKSLTTQRVMSYASIAKYRRIDAGFAARLSGLYVPNPRVTAAERAARQAARTIAALRDRPTTLAHREAFVRALRQDEVYAVVEAAVPRQLPPDMRDDVKSDLVVALLMGEVRPQDAASAARRLASAWHRMFTHHDASFDADREEGGIGGMIADPSSFSVEGTGHRVLMPGW